MITDPIQYLLPPPRDAVVLDGHFELPDEPIVDLVAPSRDAIWQRLVRGLGELNLNPLLGHPRLGHPRLSAGTDAHIRLTLDSQDPHGESYRLQIDAQGIRIQGSDREGLAHGVSTLLQWLRIHLPDPHSGTGQRKLPALRVVDRPAFRHRGVLLDISRDKVPSLATLCDLIDLLASWKINQVQLYMEHTFAYRGHEAVWRDASPLTAEDIRTLDAYCKLRFIELVPNQNSFGHFHRWLIHEPYRRLAESPEGIEHPFSVEREPFSLCPIDPGSLDLLAGLYDQLLPCFSSQTFNVGLDETFDIGFGRSAGVCAERGKGRVYLEFLQRVEKLVSDRGHRMQFWGDVILNDPELLSELPPRAIALEWGYEADHPFAEDTRLFQDSGLEFYVCPGTSSWNSFAGRVHNAVDNLASAAVHGHARGALGYLIADWGDNGHLQPLPVSYPGLVTGAAFAWNVDAAQAPHQLPLEELLDLHVFRDSKSIMGGVSLGLGNVYLGTGATAANGSALFFALIFAHKASVDRRGRGMTLARLRATLDRIEGVVQGLPSASMNRPDADLVRDELSWVADISRVGAEVALARIEIGEDEPLNALPRVVRTHLSARVGELVERHREIWLARNREGGLESSAARLSRVQQLLA